MSWLTGMRTAWAAKKNPFSLSASWDAEAISQVQRDGIVKICWCDVDTVLAYKKDCYTYDQIRVMIIGKDGAMECAEGDQKMSLLEGAVLRALPGSLPDWYLLLASQPAFETSLTYVYRRGEKSDREDEELSPVESSL